MKKKSIMFLTLILVCSCRGNMPDFEEEIDDFVESGDELVEVIEILDCKEYEDAQIGLALIEDECGHGILYLSNTMIDSDNGIVSESHGEIEPLYIYNEKEIILNPSPNKEYESDPK